MIGQTLGHYKILDKLGEGGMGEVYLAADTTLKRKVALKVLPPDLASSQDRLERFQREAEALAALDHPNIVTIHTVEEAEGTRFLTMQLVDGKPLSELIPPNGMALAQIFKIATPLADALASAHEKGIIHRDLKPANVMVTTEGRVKVLDFGLAKLSHDPSLVSTQLATEPLTQDGLILGTMPYMSPEQLQGKELDGRSDVFSLGVMLYEMATGERPFKGDTSATLIMSIGRDTAPEVDTVRGELPHHLGRVIGRCLEKDPNKRFQTIKDVRNEFAALKRETASSVTSASRIDVPLVEPRKRVWWVAVVVAGLVVAALGSWLLVREPEPGAQTSGVVRTEDVAETQAASTDATEAATGSDRKMIVVLPFENLGSSEDDYFAAGMTEEITSRLAMVSEMGVISRKSAVRYADTDKSMQEIGAELGVDYVLEGTVRWAKEGDSSRVRITPQLIQVSDDTHLWADTYDRVIQD
ncbi:MAG: serine/threonine-protein kinase, partial [Thermoanaerobaculia bacterium]